MKRITEEFTSRFPQRLNLALEKSGLTAADLCRRTGLSDGTIANYRAGRYMPKQDKCYLIAEALNVDPAWLLGFDAEPELDEAIASLLSQLSDDQKSQVLDYIRFLISKGRD